jgi:hypothetical protein
MKTKLKKDSLSWMVWNIKINQDIAMMCPSYNLEPPKFVIHKFWDCPKSKVAWEWAFTILHRLHNPQQNEIRKKVLTSNNVYLLRNHLKVTNVFFTFIPSLEVQLCGPSRLIRMRKPSIMSTRMILSLARPFGKVL